MTGDGVPIGDDDLQALIDDRLPEGRRALVARYLAEYPEIADRVALDRRHRDSLRAQLAGKFAEPVPARLRIASILSARRERRRRRVRAAAAAIAIFLAGGAIGWLAARLQPPISGPFATTAPALSVARNATAAYRTFVVEVVHPVEVDASHEAHLLHWLSKRLGRKLTAPDLSRFGYRLMGGRLLPAGAGAAAQLMYQDAGGKRLTVYVQAAQGSETAFRFRREGEASTFAWIDRGFGFAVTTRASRDDLLRIAEAVYRDFDSGRDAGPAGKG